MAGSLIRDTAQFAVSVSRFSGRRGIVTSILVALSALLEGVGIMLLIPLLATLFGTGAVVQMPHWLEWPAEIFPATNTTEKLAIILMLFGVIMAIRALILWARDRMIGLLQVGFLAAQRVEIARGLARADWQVLSRLGHSRVNHLMGGDIARCAAGVYFLLQSGIAMVMMVAQATLAFLLSPQLTLLSVAMIVLGAFAMSGLLRRSQDAGRVVTEANHALMDGLGRFLGGMKMAMSQDLQHAFVGEFEHSIGRSTDRQAAFAGQQAALRGLWSLLAAGVAGIAVLAGYAVLDISAPVLLALLVLLSRVAGPASLLHLGLQQIAYSLPAWKEVEGMKAELAAAEVRIASAAKGKHPPNDTIMFDAVGYSHGDAGGGLKDFSIRINPSDFLGISGASGAGKTTLVDLLTGLLTPQSGKVTIGGVPLGDIDLADWRRRIAYVAQDPVLFNDNVRRNLNWMAPDASDTELMEALTLVGAEEWLRLQPQGLDTIVGETGALISGGERQRLSIARALLRRPSLLILDEATSAVDIASEHQILTRLAALNPRPTIIIIAHRSESLSLCDRVVRLANGRIADGGSA